MSGQTAIARRENSSAAPSIASSAVTRSASYPRCSSNPSEPGSRVLL